MNSNHLNALLIFAKWPEPGKVKTRLSPPLETHEATELYRCMLLDTLENSADIIGTSRMIFFDGEPGRSADFKLLAPDAEVVVQEGDDLGERLANAFAKAFAFGYRSVAVVGTDSPHMPVARISEAFHLLNSQCADVIFGPSEDGGYYLVAMNSLNPGVFADIPWSSQDTLARSLEKTESLGLSPALLATGFDLDTVADLLRLKQEARPAAPRTLSLLSRIMP
ncbi:TIGR04282 family arsenosugar biosynthesis glycosyltransferase [Geobacter pelophilus]|uniref:TIGR04282 family arsenosugar biosynthesis glycosyltransferase n=1 Tax=Geoanaerobacter pelophilus TaxID=60036 RepID=A0AAW4L3G0_9BACT|nr:TIGR04282 family arsenosugar biosynthesis glycosyltransferase [Geoanaerobacter pelophilus]MBT0663518.1 TIGR04282 family arsenosugar biosynthesis glycosyltransferase [Geoanaerobacter pelophilus]